MKMVLHILLKDLRRMWAEIPLFMVTCAMWAYTKTHPVSSDWLREKLQYTPDVLFGLWILITIRMVHGESLVGDREFWITRPYRWGYLMAEKFLTLIVFLNVPLLLAQIYVLHAKGFPITASLVPGLFFLACAFAFFVTFPVAVLAAVTQSFGQWVTAVGALIFFVFVVTWLPWNKLPAALSGTENLATLLGAAIIVPALAFVLVWQYVRRRTWLARFIVGAAVLSVPIVILTASTSFARSIAYPRVNSSAPFNLWIENKGADGSRQYTRADSYQSTIAIPLGLTSSDPNTLIEIDGWRAVLTGDNGWKWDSKWVNHSTRFNTISNEELSIEMPEGVANQLANAHATARVEVAFNIYRMGPIQRINTSADPFELPGGGNCKWGSRYRFRITDCAAPLRLPEVRLVQMESGESTCPERVKGIQLPAGHIAISDDYSGTSMPADFNLDPVRDFSFNFGQWIPALPGVKDEDQTAGDYFCRGTPLTVRTGSKVDSGRVTFTLGNIGSEIKVKPTDDVAE